MGDPFKLGMQQETSFGHDGTSILNLQKKGGFPPLWKQSDIGVEGQASRADVRDCSRGKRSQRGVLPPRVNEARGSQASIDPQNDHPLAIHWGRATRTHGWDDGPNRAGVDCVDCNKYHDSDGTDHGPPAPSSRSALAPCLVLLSLDHLHYTPIHSVLPSAATGRALPLPTRRGSRRKRKKSAGLHSHRSLDGDALDGAEIAPSVGFDSFPDRTIMVGPRALLPRLDDSSRESWTDSSRESWTDSLAQSVSAERRPFLCRLVFLEKWG